VSRRQFLTFGGATAAGLVVGGAVGYAVHQPPSQPASQTPPPPIRFFTDAQFRVVEAMAERIFPADSEGPGAKEARVAYYIDGQLTSGWGRGERLYLQGPFVAPADSGHGWQIPMTPRDVYKDGLAAIDAYTQKQFNKPYDQLTAKQQDDILQMLSGGKVSTFQTVTSAQFFSMFRQNVLEGPLRRPALRRQLQPRGVEMARVPRRPPCLWAPVRQAHLQGAAVSGRAQAADIALMDERRTETWRCQK